MKKFYLLLLVLGTCLLFRPEARASHIMGADLTYTYIGTTASGQQRYFVVLNFYRDCCPSCLVAGPSDILTVTNNCTGVVQPTYTLVNQSCPNGCEVVTLCPGNPSTCGNGNIPGVMKYTDTVTITIPTGCNDWVVSWTDGARNSTITNLSNPSSQSVYIEAVINNSTNPATNTPYTNSSVFFTKNPVPFACSNNPDSILTYSNGAVDANGDSLVYTLVDPLTAANSPIAHMGTYSATQPISSNPPVSFDVHTGILAYKPTGQEVDVITFLVKEYRNGVLVGSVMRDVQLTIINCSPAPSPAPDGGNPVNLVNSDTTGGRLKGCPGTTMSFDIPFNDPNGRNVTLTSDINGTPSAIPGATFVQIGTGSLVIGRVTWTPLPSDTGCHPFEINVHSDDCPIPTSNVTAYTICVLTKVSVSPHSIIYCGSPIHLIATGGSNATWSPTAGLTFPGSIYTPLAAPTQTTTYVFTSDCGSDSSHIIYNPPFTMDAGAGGSICQNSSIQLNASVDNLYAPYQILWTPSTGLTDPLTHAAVNNTLNPVASPPSTTVYTVQFTANTGCIRTDTVKVVVNGYAPALQAKANPTHLCPGQQTQLTVTANPECGLATTPCTGNSRQITVGTGTSNQGGSGSAYPSPYGNALKSARHQFLFHASELSSLIGSGGQITSVAMNVGVLNSGSTCTNFTIRMGCVDTSITDLTGYVNENLLSTVYVANYTTVNGWNNHNLQTAYNWDGKSNLVVDVCFINTTSGNINCKMKYTTTPFQSVWCTYANDAGGQCGYTGRQQGLPPGAGTLFQRPNFRFNVCTTDLSNANLTWTPLPPSPNAADSIHKDSTYAHPINQTTYHITLVDTNGCSSTDYVTVFVDTTVQLTMAGSTFICSPSPVPIQANARIAASSPVTPAQLVYTWSTNPVTATSPPSGTGPGFAHPTVNPTGTTTYIVMVTGPGLCNITDSITIQLGNGLPVNKIVDSITCSGLNNGRIAVSMTTGTPPYSYAWNPAAGNIPTVSNLGPGTYYVTITDAAGCTGIDTTTLLSPSPLVLTLDSTDVLCYGDANGSATATVSGGRAPYRYTWNPSGSNTNSLTGLAARGYALTVTDTSGCTITDQTAVNQPAQLTSFATSTNLTGATTHDGAVTTHTTGGTTPYRYTWICPAPAVVGNVSSATGLDSGHYYIHVCDTNNCCVWDTAHVTVPPPINVVFTITNVTCFDSCNGQVSAVATGGVLPYTYGWSTTPVSTTDTIKHVCAGSYTLTVTDANGISVANTIVVTSPTPIDIAIDSVPITCFGANNGSMDATPSGGTGTFNVIWSAGADPLSNLGPGMYIVNVTDQNGCSAIDTGYLGQPAQLVATIASTDSVKCFGESNGVARVTTTGGRPPYTYQWTQSASVVDSATDLNAGTHTVIVTDAAGCTATVSCTIYQPLQILVNVTTTKAHCEASNDGTATATVSNGTPPYTYTWDGNPGNSSANGLSAGLHNVIVADVNGCSTQQAFTIDTLYVLHISLVADSANCNGGDDGMVTVTVANGTPSYDYEWTTSINNGSNPAVGLSAGMQVVTVTDAYQCVAIDSAEVFEPSEIVVLPTFTNPLCTGDANGKIWLSASGGHGPPYTYVFTNDGTTHQMSDTITGLPQNVPNTANDLYRFTLTDTRGCEQKIAVTLTDPPLLTISSQITAITCSNANNGVIEVAGNGGTPGYTYTWSTGGASDKVRTNLPPGIYDITVTDANGCQKTVADTLVAPPVISVTTLKADSTGCPGASDGGITIVVIGGTPGTPVAYEYSIDNTNWQSDSVFSNLPAGDYHVYARDGQHCQLDTIISVIEPTAITLAINPQDTSIVVGGSMQLISLIGNQTTQSINGYSWSPATGLSCIDCPNPVATPYQTTTYVLTVNYGKNCYVTAGGTIDINHGPDTYIPSGFSPNGDGNNDEFTVYGSRLKSVGMRVFNRWGEKVFDSMDNQWASWDGTYMGVGQPPSVYTYVVTLTYLDGVKKTREGSITLIR